jgi:hypothetical protein
MPKWVTTEEDWQEFVQYHRDNLGIDLDRSKMKLNAPLKQGSKLVSNSLWGKFGERSKRHQWQRFLTGTEDDQIIALENQWSNGDIDIYYRKYSGDNKAVGMVYAYVDDLPQSAILQKKRRAHTNIALASMITSHARCRLWKELNKLNDRVLYHDTDSIIYEYRPEEYNIPEGRYLGEWECEEEGLPLTKFTSTGPKCYSYIVRCPDNTERCKTKVKGITLTSANSALVNYHTMKKLVMSELNHIETESLLFKYDRVSGTMVTRNAPKLFKMTYNKGEINPTNWKVYPFGWNRFQNQVV